MTVVRSKTVNEFWKEHAASICRLMELCLFTWHSTAAGPSIASDVFVTHRHFDAYGVVQVTLDAYRVESNLT
jgi:hypothetical protein